MLALVLAEAGYPKIKSSRSQLSVLKGQCLDRRIPEMAARRAHVAAWEKARNNSARKIVWQLKTSDARIKLRHLYPKL